MSPFSSSTYNDTNSRWLPGGWASRAGRRCRTTWEGRLCATGSTQADPGRRSSPDDELAAELEAALPWLRAHAVPVGSPFSLSITFLFYTRTFHQDHMWFRTCCQRKMGSGNYYSSKGGPHTFSMGLVPLTGRRWLVSIDVGTNWLKLK